MRAKPGAVSKTEKVRRAGKARPEQAEQQRGQRKLSQSFLVSRQQAEAVGGEQI